MNLRKTSAALLVVMFAATAAFAQLSTENAEWGKGPAKHLMTRDEAKAWKNVRTDADAKNFIDLFWAKRDPSPATPENEFKADFDARVKVADDRFSTVKTQGSASDRGRVFLLLGAPTRFIKADPTNRPKPTSGWSEEDGAALSAALTEKWVYEKDQVPEYLANAGYKTFEVVFTDQFANGEYKLDRGKVNMADVLDRALAHYVVSPKLTAVPTYEAPRPAAPEPVVVAAVAKGEIKDEALKAAVAAFKAAKESPYKGLAFHYMENVTPDGTHYVPMMVYAAKGSALAAGQDVTFFGIIEDSTGTEVLAFEEPAKLMPSREDVFFDKSLTLAPGKYVAYVGVAQAGQPVSMVRGELDVAGVTKEQSGSSRIILSNNIYVLPAAQQATDPYAFGGLKVVPKADRVFTTADELLYFFEVRNPGLTPEGAPSFQAKIEVEGQIPAKDAKGKAITQKKKYSMPLTQAEVAQVKDTEGHFSGGQGIPLATFKPGEYTFRLKLIDTVTQANYNLEEKFTVVAAPAAPAAN